MTQRSPQRLAGDEYVGFNNAVFLSEREAADRNYALGFYMRENKCFPPKSNLREVMDFYFQVRNPLPSISLFRNPAASVTHYPCSLVVSRAREKAR